MIRLKLMGYRLVTWRDAVYQVLKKNKGPMHYRKITEHALKIKSTKGKTPSLTVLVELIRDERFIRIDEGVYGLKE